MITAIRLGITAVLLWKIAHGSTVSLLTLLALMAFRHEVLAWLMRCLAEEVDEGASR